MTTMQKIEISLCTLLCTPLIFVAYYSIFKKGGETERPINLFYSILRLSNSTNKFGLPIRRIKSS